MIRARNRRRVGDTTAEQPRQYRRTGILNGQREAIETVLEGERGWFVCWRGQSPPFGVHLRLARHCTGQPCAAAQFVPQRADRCRGGWIWWPAAKFLKHTSV